MFGKRFLLTERNYRLTQGILDFAVAEMVGTFTKVNVGSGVLAWNVRTICKLHSVIRFIAGLLAGTSEQVANFTQTSTATGVLVSSSDQIANFSSDMVLPLAF